ncbi:uncharacterized protein LOC109791429 isoform X2 [Cajanus cajan]|uniref:uncharacterized protein LOC109791429 isoform X2 n=1 Tax=Cajanus cajan TaxID=3821 RepID=UPI0010FB1BE5|nr:uncharacterized protein LOC109791429 isoform X2 [Cajanus cajan]
MAFSAVSRLANLQRHLDLNGTSNKAVQVNVIEKSIKVKVASEVSEALSLGRAVVALESTIISHGMPYPQNLETAREVERIVRENGAVPATIAILDGTPCIGLSIEELERLAILGTRAQKTARRDIAHVVAQGGNGATTVSATMFFAAMVHIPVFVTGGIGGVHRHWEHSLDISSDLTELARTPVAVVCAGVKSILDIPRTLEYLETLGVCVAAYKTNEFPAFFTESSGCKDLAMGKTILTAKEQSELYLLESDDQNKIKIISQQATSETWSNSQIWIHHKRLGHPSFNLIKPYQVYLIESLDVSCRVDTPEDCACLIEATIKLKLGTGILIAVPIPQEHSTSGHIIESAIQKAIKEARENNITGNADTPFLLARINDLTGGASLAANIALVKNNAIVGTQVAVALAQRENCRRR